VNKVVFELFKSLLTSGKEIQQRVLEWIYAVLNANSSLFKIQPDHFISSQGLIFDFFESKRFFIQFDGYHDKTLCTIYCKS